MVLESRRKMLWFFILARKPSNLDDAKAGLIALNRLGNVANPIERLLPGELNRDKCHQMAPRIEMLST
jgi:hypothetical protein